MNILPFEGTRTPSATPEQRARMIRLFHTLNAAGLTAFSPKLPGDAARTALNCGITLAEIAHGTHMTEPEVLSWTRYEDQPGHAKPEPIIAALFIGNLRHLLGKRLSTLA